MFGKFFSKKNKTGIYKINTRKLIELEETPGNGSINTIIEHLGYPPNHIHTILLFDSKKIDSIGFEILSKKPVFAIAKGTSPNITFSDITKIISEIDWEFEYSSLSIEDILNEGIDAENLSLSFLKSVIKLEEGEEEGERGLYKSEKLGLFLQFEKNILKAFSSSKWDNTSTKWLEELNSNMVLDIKKEAILYHDNEIDIMEEVNMQTNSLLKIPNALKNEFVHFHTSEHQNINFYNLLVTHYNHPTNLDEFTFMNKGRNKRVGISSFEIGNFIYEFDYDSKELERVKKKT